MNLAAVCQLTCIAVATLLCGYAEAQGTKAKEAKKEDELRSAPTMYLVAKNEHTWLTIDCDGEPPFRRMTCLVKYVSLREPDRKRQEAEKAAAAEAIRSASAKERAQGMSGLRKELCANLDAAGSTRMRELEGQPEGRRQVALEEHQHLKKFCACNDWECAIALFPDFEGDTCKVDLTVMSPIDFERTGKRTWVARLQAGLCAGVTTVIVLEHESSSSRLWTMTQTRVGVVDQDDKFCNYIELNKPAIYSWRYADRFRLNCSAFKFGP